MRPQQVECVGGRPAIPGVGAVKTTTPGKREIHADTTERQISDKSLLVLVRRSPDRPSPVSRLPLPRNHPIRVAMPILLYRVVRPASASLLEL